MPFAVLHQASMADGCLQVRDGDETSKKKAELQVG